MSNILKIKSNKSNSVIAESQYHHGANVLRDGSFVFRISSYWSEPRTRVINRGGEAYVQREDEIGIWNDMHGLGPVAGLTVAYDDHA